MSLTISFVIQGFDLTFNREVLWERVYYRYKEDLFPVVPFYLAATTIRKIVRLDIIYEVALF